MVQNEATTQTTTGSKGQGHKGAMLGMANPVTRRNLCPLVLHRLFDGNDPIGDLRLSGNVGVVVREATSADDAQLLIAGNMLTPTNTRRMGGAQLFLLINLCGVIPIRRTIAWTTLEDRDVFTPLNVPSPKCNHHQMPMDHQQIIMNPFNGSAAQCQPNKN